MGEQKEGEKKKSEGGEKKGDNGAITIVLKLDMHCEGCAKKVKRCIVKNFDGVESVKADWENSKLTVVAKADPMKVKERVEEKTKKQVELISPQPNKASKDGNGGGGGGEKKSDEKKPDEKKSEKKSSDKKPEGKEKKDDKPKEIQVSTVVLKTRVHCEGCAHKIKKIVGKCQGVLDASVDLKMDTITIKGTMDMKELLPYLNVKLKRTVELAPSPKKEEGGAAKEKKLKEGNGPSEKPKEGGQSGKPKEGGAEKKEGGGGEKKEKKDGSSSKPSSGGDGGEGSSVSQEHMTRIEINKSEYGGYPYGQGYGLAYAYDPRQQQEGYGHQVTEYWHAPEYNSHPPQMFSDENPNACSVM